MQKPQKIPPRSGLDHLLLPKNIDYLAIYTAVKNVATSAVSSQIMVWIIVLSMGVPSGIQVACFFTPAVIFASIAIRLGFHRLGRIGFWVGSAVPWIFWSQIYGPSSFIWLYHQCHDEQHICDSHSRKETAFGLSMDRVLRIDHLFGSLWV